ncbi:uncharacterized G-patch domain protein DDB_G0278987-like [Centruroides sculpturatus]|uniref:uncharacterized G-patch domain protein DDB_G0278987-like n=1 Tax=Centruroides sculpturatus TaxID=218467 RepID=UPI000C6E25A0|nr:uncharacterized G-patch domain protein DDB_G0278987-like [Centruroides sculpturatus]
MDFLKVKYEESEENDNPEETELSSSDSDDDIEGFHFCLRNDQITPFKRKRRPLKRAFVYMKNYSLAKETITEEEELSSESSDDDASLTNTNTDLTSKSSSELNKELKVLDQETNAKKERMVEIKKMIKLEDRENSGLSTPKDESLEDNEETTKCFDVFVEFFHRISSFICFGCRKRN